MHRKLLNNKFEGSINRLENQLMLWLGEALRIKGRIAALVAAGSGAVLFLPEGLAEQLALTGLREASFNWVVGVVFLLSLGLFIVRIGEFLADARRAYREDDDLRAELNARKPQELEILNRAVKEKTTSLDLQPSLLPEIRPLVELGLLQEVTSPDIKSGSYGLYLVPLRVFQILQKRARPSRYKALEFLPRVGRAVSDAYTRPFRLGLLSNDPLPRSFLVGRHAPRPTQRHTVSPEFRAALYEWFTQMDSKKEEGDWKEDEKS